MKNMRSITAGLLLLAFGSVEAANFCGELKNGYGPFDYRLRAENPDRYSIVENAHFTEEVEQGIKGSTSAIGGDLDYTLRAIPNHIRALAAMARVGMRTKSLIVQGAKYPVECYFDRAMRFRPNDGAVLAQYGNYMFAQGKEERAFALYREAVNISPDDAVINYNLGLAYFKRKDFVQAQVYAKQAYALGFPLPSLRNKLKQAGHWQDKPGDNIADKPADKLADKPAGKPADKPAE